MSIKSINQKALKIFNQTGFPQQKNEHWKYTNLKKFQSLKFSQPNNFNFSKNNFNDFDFLNIPTITIINGQIDSIPEFEGIDLLSNKLDNCSNELYNSFIQGSFIRYPT